MPLFACYSRVDIPRDLINYKKKELEKKYVRIATNYSHESSKELCQILLNECSIQNTKILITLGYYGLLNSQLAVLNKTNILQMFLIMSKVRDYNCLLVYKSGILRILYKYAMVLKTERRYCFNKNIPQSEIKRFSEYVIHVLEEFANYNSFDSLIAEGVPPGVKKLCEESKIIKSKLIKKGIKFTMDSFETPYHRNISMNTMGGSNDMVVVKTFPEKLKELQNDLFSLENQMTQLGLFDPDVRPEESIISDLISSLSLYEYRAQNLIQESVDAEQMELYDDTVTLLDYIKYLINILKTKICESLNSNYIETHLSAQEFEQFVTIPQTEEHHESNIDENNIEINLEIQEIEQLEQSDASTEFFDSASDEEEIEEVMVDDTEQEHPDDMRKERDKDIEIENIEKEMNERKERVMEEEDKDKESKSLEQLEIEVEKEYKDKGEKEDKLDKYKLLDNYDSSDNKITNINKSLLSTVDELISTRSESSYPQQQVIDKTSNLDGKHVLFENIVDEEEEVEETDSETIEVDSDDELEEVVSIDSREERKYKENEMNKIKERVMENEVVESEYEEESNEESDEMDSDVEEVVDEDTDDREYYEEFRKLEEDIEDDIDEELEIMYNKDDYLDDELIYEEEDDTFSDKKDLYLFEKEFSESNKLEQKLSLDILKNEKLEDKKDKDSEREYTDKEKLEKKLSEHLEIEQEILVDSHKSLSKEQLEIEKLEEEKLFWSTEDKDSSEKTSLFSVMSKSKSLSLEEVVEDIREKDKDKEKEDKEYKGDETKKVIEKKLEKVKFKDVKEMVKKIENKSLGQLDIEDNRDIETKVIIVETKERKDVKEMKEKELSNKKEETKETKKVIEEKDKDSESKSLEQLVIEVDKEEKENIEYIEEENKEKEELKQIKHELILPVRKEDESIKELYNEMSYVMDTLKRINNYLESKPPKFVANSKNYQNIQSSSFRSLSFDNINISNLYNNNTQERLDNKEEYRDGENKEKLERDIYKTQDNNNNNMNMKFNRDELQLKKIENKLELELGEQFLEKERQLKQQLFSNIDDNLFKRISNIYLPKKNLPMTSTILPYDNSFVTSSIASSNHPQYNITNNYYSTTHNPRNYYNTNNTTNLPHNYYNTTNTTHTHGTTNYYSTNSTHLHSHSYGSSHNYYNTNNHTNNYNTNSSSCIYNYYYSYDDSSLQQINENKTSDEKGIHREINKNMIIFKKGIPSDNLRNRLMINYERENKEYKDKEEYIEEENENKETKEKEDKKYKENKKLRGLDYDKDQEFNTNNNIVLEPNNELKQLNKLTKLLSLDVTSDNNEKETRDKDKVEKLEETKKVIEEKDQDSEREYTDKEEEGDIDKIESEKEYSNKEKTYREEKNTYENGYPVIDISEFENLEEESLMGRDSNRELEVELESLDRSEYRDNRRYEDKDDMDDNNRDDYIDKEYEESEREDIESREERKYKEKGRNERKYREKEMNEIKERVMEDEETDSETKYYNKENRKKGTRLERNRDKDSEREYTDKEEDSEIEKEGKEIRKNKDKKERKYKEYIYPQEVHHTHHYYKRSVHHYIPHNSNKYDYYDPRYEEREYNENNETKYYNKEYERETDRKYERDIDKKNKNKYKERDYQEKKERRNKKERLDKKEEYRQYERNYDIDNNRIYDDREYRDNKKYKYREYRDDRNNDTRYEDTYYYEDNYRRTPLREQYPRNELYYVIEPNSSNEILNKKNKNIRIDYDSRYYDMEYDEKENKKYKDRKIIEVNDSNSSLSGRNMEYIKNREYDRNNDTRYEDREYRDDRRYEYREYRDDYIDKEYRDRYYDEVDSELEQEMTYRDEDNMREKINKKQDKENNEKEYYNNEYKEKEYYNKEYKENNINSTPRTTFRTTFRSESVTSNNIEEENRIIYDNNIKENNTTGLEYINEDEIKYYNKEINKEYDKYSEKYKVSDNIDNMMITNSNIIKNVIKYGGDIIYEDKMILIKFTQSPIYHPGNNTYIQLEHNYTMSTENILILENNSLFSYSISFDYSNFDNFPLDIKFLNNKFNKIELIPGQKLTHRFNADCFGPFIGLPKLNLTIHIDIKTDKIFQIYLPLAISCFFTPSMDMFRLSKSYFNSDKFKHIMRNKVYFNTPKKINLGQIMEIVTGFGKFKLLQQAENCYYLASSFSAPFYFGTKELYRFTIFAMIEVSTSHYHVHVSSDSYRLANSTSMLLKYILQN